MKKILFTILSIWYLIFGANIIFANDIDQMMIDVKIQDDGRFRVMETWQGNFTAGTENYKSINTKKVSISDFQVGMLEKDSNGNEVFNEFTYNPNYDINATFDHKKYTCGMNVVGMYDVELCFGITKYGNNTYVISYTVDPGVIAYSDYDGFNYMFVNPGLNTPIKHLSTRISIANGTPLSSDNARIWAFGANGHINFNRGSVICDILNYGYNNYQIIMMRLDKGIINPTHTNENSFTDVQNDAFAGSDYEYTEKEDIFDKIIKIIIGFFVLLMFAGVVYLIKRALAIKNFYKNAEYFRDLPNKNDIALNAALYEDFKIVNSKNSKFNLIGALMLKMINEKNLEHIKEESVGFLGIVKEANSLKLMKEPIDKACKDLYDIIKVAAGSDGILQEKELSAYAEKYYEVIENFVDDVISRGRSNLHNLGGYKNPYGNTINSLNDVGKTALSEVYGLRKYLDDYTLINERGVEEIEIWDNYLVYAQIFGIAEKVLKQLKKLYPDNIRKIETYNDNMNMSYIYYRSLTRGINTYHQKMSQAEKSGFGGSMSFGGGGGFSGGGFGGGSR